MERSEMTTLEQFLMENGFVSKSDRDKLLERNESLDSLYEGGSSRGNRRYLKQCEDWRDTYTECPF